MISGEDKRLRQLMAILDRGDAIGHTVACGVSDQDDAAILKFPPAHDLVVTSDFVRGPGFDLFEAGLLNYTDIGYYLIIANLSDLAAMGASPFAITTVVRYPKDLDDGAFAALFEGMQAAATHYRVPIVGGDIGGYTNVVLAATAMGSVPTGKGLRRKGARPADVLCVSGYAGRAVSAQLYFLKAKPAGLRLPEEEEAVLLDAWRRPIARVAEGETLMETAGCTAAQDSSDGLRTTINQLADASDVGFRVYGDRINILPSTATLAQTFKMSPLEIALSTSPDFSLVFTVRPDRLQAIRDAFSRRGLSFQVLGEATESRELMLVHPDNSASELPGWTWNQANYTYLDELAQGKVSKRDS